MNSNDKNWNGKSQNFIRSTKASSPTGNSGTANIPSIGDSFMYIETSSNNSGSDNVLCSYERTDIFQITNITYYYDSF